LPPFCIGEVCALYTERCAGHCSVTGVTCHRMLAKVDAGEIVGTTMVRERATLRGRTAHSLTAQCCTTALRREGSEQWRLPVDMYSMLHASRSRVFAPRTTFNMQHAMQRAACNIPCSMQHTLPGTSCNMQHAAFSLGLLSNRRELFDRIETTWRCACTHLCAPVTRAAFVPMLLHYTGRN
jgi:hypothetical protein